MAAHPASPEWWNGRHLIVSTICVIIRRMLAGVSQLVEEAGSSPVKCGFESLHPHYAYILGMYLGDGYIAKHPRTYRMRITLDTKYPDIVARCQESASLLYSKNKVSLVPKTGCVEVSWYSKSLPKDFPQHGIGRKHLRKISLEEWQEKIVKNFPKEFLTGLIQSDGCRDLNIVNGKSYPRYSFSNESEDIKNLFEKTVTQLGFHFTRMGKGKTVSIAKREDVEKLDQFIGPKT